MTKVNSPKAKGKRLEKGEISIIKALCPFCYHHKAWSKNVGTICSRCGKDINQ